MRLLIAAVGKLKDEEERAICARYAKRITASAKSIALGPLEFVEFAESRKTEAADRKTDEAGRLLKSASSADFTIALDAAGKAYDSDLFAALLRTQRDSGAKLCAFLIGGPDGHGPAALDAADVTLSLGRLTMAHGLARVVLIEQLYRAGTIIAGHPYHRR